MHGVTVRGTVEGYNYNPKGEADGVLVRAGKQVVQVNLPPHAVPTAGAVVELDVEPEGPGPAHAQPAHLVYRSEGHRARPGAAPDKFEGVVVRLNFTKHGEPNGVVLDSGDFVHLKPHGMRAVGLKVGDKVTASGKTKPLAGGLGWAVDADEVNGEPITKPH